MGVENGKPYIPHNFDFKDSGGEVTARYALQHSINTATIRLAQMVGLDKVMELAKAAGVEGVKATPAMAIGAYDATPLQMAEAYTVFANERDTSGASLCAIRSPSERRRNGETRDTGQSECAR